MHSDFLVIGGGTAGCQVAAFLAQNNYAVVLVEAGRDTLPGQTPEDIQDTFPSSYSNPAYTSGSMRAYSIVQGQSTSTPFFQAQVMGGGSSLMGMVALRGYPSDYDKWQDMGAQGWGWKDVLPEFMALESDTSGLGLDHGQNGPIQILRRGPEVWPPFCSALAKSMTDLGHSYVADMNSQFEDGFCTYPLSCTPQHRVSSASAFLTLEIRKRVRIFSRAQAQHLLWEKNKCIGARIKTAHGLQDVHAGRVVLCAGGIHTPALLMRSGVGPARQLHAGGWPVWLDLPAVGTQLQNHVVVYLGAYLKPQGRQSKALRPHFHMGLRMSSPDRPRHTGDIAMTVLPKSSLAGMGTAIGALGVALYQPQGRGRVIIDAQGRPEPIFSYIEQKQDFERLCWGMGQAYQLMQHPAVAELRELVFAAGFSDKIRRFNRPGIGRSVMSHALLRAMDFSSSFRTWLLDEFISGGEAKRFELGSEEWIRHSVQSLHFGMYHPTSTCKMGSENDPSCVVDSHGKVIGAEGLWVADASVMPNIPRANTFLPTLMVSRKIAQYLCA